MSPVGQAYTRGAKHRHCAMFITPYINRGLITPANKQEKDG